MIERKCSYASNPYLAKIILELGRNNENLLTALEVGEKGIDADAHTAPQRFEYWLIP